MRKIDIKNSETLAKEYKTELCKKGIKKKIEEKIKEEEEEEEEEKIKEENRYKECSNQSAIKYLRLLQESYEKLLISSPCAMKDFIKDFEGIIPRDSFSNPPNIKAANSISKVVQGLLKYDTCRPIIRKKFKQLGLRTCFYCNSQYAVGVEEKNQDGQPLELSATYQIDHFLPKALFPYLSTSFYNFVPTCGYCNLKKSTSLFDTDVEKHLSFSLWRKKEESDYPEIIFTLDNVEVIEEWIEGGKKPNIDSPLLILPTEGPAKTLCLGNLYQEYTDVAQEIIYRAYACNNKGYEQSIKSLGFPEEIVKRFVWGAYMDKQDVHKRPLTRMTQDIARQLGMLTEEN